MIGRIHIINIGIIEHACINRTHILVGPHIPSVLAIRPLSFRVVHTLGSPTLGCPLLVLVHSGCSWSLVLLYIVAFYLGLGLYFTYVRNIICVVGVIGVGHILVGFILGLIALVRFLLRFLLELQ